MSATCPECGGDGSEERPHEAKCQAGLEEFGRWLSDNVKDEYKFFLGPCEHGRDPWDRCEDGCNEAGQACWNAAIEAAAKVAETWPCWHPEGEKYRAVAAAIRHLKRPGLTEEKKYP